MLTLHFMPYSEIETLGPEEKVVKLLDIVKEDKIVVLEGKLSSEEESMLIKKTMERIDKNFIGIEIADIDPQQKSGQFILRLRRGLAKALLGNKGGLTIVGPASIVKEIKRDPNKIELLTKDIRKKRRKKK